MSMPPPNEAPPLFPVFLDLAGEKVLIVGEGDAAAAKLRALHRCGAVLRIVGAAPGGALAALAQAAGADVCARGFVPEDLDGVRLCYVALEDAAEAAAVAAEARRCGVLVNCIDRPPLSDFATPAMVERGGIAIAISTGGAAPALARDLRARIEIAIPPAYGTLAAFCRRWRRRVAAALAGRAERRRFWDAVLDGPEAAAVLRGETAAADALIERRLAGSPPPPRGEIVWIDAAAGDPDLLPLKALRALQRADLVFYDDSVAPAILDLARREARRVALDVTGDETTPLVAFRQAQRGARVVRLAGAGRRSRGREEKSAINVPAIAEAQERLTDPGFGTWVCAYPEKRRSVGSLFRRSRGRACEENAGIRSNASFDKLRMRNFSLCHKEFTSS